MIGKKPNNAVQTQYKFLESNPASTSEWCNIGRDHLESKINYDFRKKTENLSSHLHFRFLFYNDILDL